jgi:hypothetical protein
MSSELGLKKEGPPRVVCVGWSSTFLRWKQHGDHFMLRLLYLECEYVFCFASFSVCKEINNLKSSTGSLYLLKYRRRIGDPPVFPTPRPLSRRMTDEAMTQA